MRIKAVPFGIAFGGVYAAVFFLYGVLAALFGWGTLSRRSLAASTPASDRRWAAR